MKKEFYILSVGEAGRKRLSLLNKIYEAASHSFLLESGLRAGMQVLDVGCGTGEISCWLAKKIGPEGKVVALDQSQEQLKIAKINAQKQGIENIEFVELSIYDLPQLKRNFDFIYCRWVLRHIENPTKGLQAIYNVLKKNGIFVCIDTSIASVFCYPESGAFQHWKEMWIKNYAISHREAELGVKIYHLLLENGFHPEKVKLFQPILLTTEEKRLIAYYLEETGEQLIANKLLNVTELPQLQKELYALAEQEYFIGFDRNTQIVARK